jgi:hypothetical protein
MGQLQSAQKPIVKAARVLAGAGDPTPDGCFGEIEDASRGTWTETFGNGVQDLGDLGRRRFETVEWGMPPRCEFPAARLAIEILDRVIRRAVVSVPN